MKRNSALFLSICFVWSSSSLAQTSAERPGWNNPQKAIQSNLDFPQSSIIHRVNFNDAPVKRVIAEICSKGGATIVFDRSVNDQRLTAEYMDLTTDELFYSILNDCGLKAKRLMTATILVEAKNAENFSKMQMPELSGEDTIKPIQPKLKKTTNIKNDGFQKSSGRRQTFELVNNGTESVIDHSGLVPPPPPFDGSWASLSNTKNSPLHPNVIPFSPGSPNIFYQTTPTTKIENDTRKKLHRKTNSK